MICCRAREPYSRIRLYNNTDQSAADAKPQPGEDQGQCRGQADFGEYLELVGDAIWQMIEHDVRESISEEGDHPKPKRNPRDAVE